MKLVHTPIENSNSHQLLIFAGDIELNPGPRNNKCGSCHKIVRFFDKAIKCDDCGHWIHNRCSSTDDGTYIRLQNSDQKWYCSDCAAPCGICTENVFRYNLAIECDTCKLWIHNVCAV